MARDDIDPRIEITRGAPTSDELAALIAVVREAYVEEAAASSVDDERPADRWRTARRLRQVPGRGQAWGRFRG